MMIFPPKKTTKKPNPRPQPVYPLHQRHLQSRDGLAVWDDLGQLADSFAGADGAAALVMWGGASSGLVWFSMV